MKLTLLFCALFFDSIFAAVIGQPASVQANVATSLDYGIGGPSLVITVDRDASVTLSLYASINVALPAGFQQLSFGSNIGYSLSLNPSNAVIISAQLTTPSLSLSSVGVITGSVQAGCLQFDGTTYNQIDVQSYNSISKTITVNLPTSGVYVFVGFQQGIVIPSFYNQARELAAGVATTIRYTGGFLLNVTASASTSVTVTFHSSNPSNGSDPQDKTSAGAYWEIELSSQSNVDATLSYTYDSAALATQNILAETLEFGYYTISGWQFDGNAQVDTQAKVVSQQTNHFSTWGVFGTSDAHVMIPSLLLFAVLIVLM